MRLLFVRPDGTVYVEKMNLNKKLIELQDGGYYPAPPEAVWNDRKHRRGTLMLYFSGLLSPIGAKMPLEYIWAIQDEFEVVKVGRKPMSISKLWIRRLQAFFQWFATYGLTILIILFIGLTVLYSLLTGGV